MTSFDDDVISSEEENKDENDENYREACRRQFHNGPPDLTFDTRKCISMNDFSKNNMTI